MLLLYRPDQTTVTRMLYNLHSTMLLLYRIWFQGETLKSIIYIPLCFYFIEWTHLHHIPEQRFTFHYASTLSGGIAFDEGDRVHLHSTMLLLYRIHHWREQKVFWFTFHYASTLSESKMTFDYNSEIYIPLCFYFIRVELCPSLASLSIYIPLCFYFIDPFFKHCAHTNAIYIPLCFYFI